MLSKCALTFDVVPPLAIVPVSARCGSPVEERVAFCAYCVAPAAPPYPPYPLPLPDPPFAPVSWARYEPSCCSNDPSIPSSEPCAVLLPADVDPFQEPYWAAFAPPLQADPTTSPPP